ncbi:MAG: tetratricopeptide repeat protein [Lewinellaceae bacterium]|nr:tetratricopeptide repeat protein [Lewinellaceae bacterium]
MRNFAMVLLLASVLQANGQQALVDSLRSVFLHETDPQHKLEVYYAMAVEAQELDLESAFPYADTLEQLAKANHNLQAQAQAYHIRGTALYDKGNYSEAIPVLKKSLSLYQQDHNTKGMGIVYNSLGGLYSDFEKQDSAIYYFLKASEIFEKTEEKTKLASVYSNIGNLYVDRKLFDKGIDLLKKALAIRQQIGDEKKSIYTYNNLAVAYGTKGDLDEAMNYSKKGIEIALKYGNKYVAGVISGGMGNLLLKAKRYPDAIQMCEQSIRLLKEANRRPNLVFPLANLANIYNNINQPQKALEYAKEGYAIMLETQQSVPMEVYLEQMADAYEKLGNHKEALIWYRKFMVLDDSLFRAENNQILADTETKYQTKKKEAEIAQQQLQIGNQQAAIFRQRAWIFGLLGGLLSFGILGYLFITVIVCAKKQRSTLP